MIISDYPMLTVADITFIFKKAITGKYGEFYESLSIPKIMKWFADYFEERCEIAEMISQQEHSKSKEPLSAKWNNEVVKEMFKGVSETISERPPLPTLPEILQSSEKYQEMLKESCKNLSVDQLEKIISKWKKYPNKEVYQKILEKELKSREKQNP
ncbi:hypothetical protein [Flavobacterium kingsejongi]|nr:hypothetical protein [Flavobacterium kingsejongi]